MATKIQEMKWKLHNYKIRKLLIWGLKNGLITTYDEELLEKLRNIYDGGIPASIILLSNAMSNGHCYDRAVLMSKAFLDSDDDVQLLYATVDSLKLNPYYINDDDPDYADHCIVERTTKDRKQYIYDTSSGFIYDKKLYWLMENPKVRKINKKRSIIKYVNSEEFYYPEDIERDKYASPLILPMIELTFNRPTEMYSQLGDGMLQREIELFKEKINYDAVCKEIDDDMRRLGMRK